MSTLPLTIRLHPNDNVVVARIDILPGTGLENINDTGSRWSLPISAFLTLRF